MDKMFCKNCIHFRQHYMIGPERATPVNCGHCVYPRLKERKPDISACKHFCPISETESLPNRAEVIQFLTVDVMKQIMELPLPPEMEHRR